MTMQIIPPLRIISWNITLRCPLRCSHCYSDAGDQDVADVLTTTEARGILDQIREAGSPVVILSGGEPMMREDIYDIARYGTDVGLRMALGTSGYTFDENTPKQLKDAGIENVAISIDSANPFIHDTYRGLPGAWNNAVRAIRLCLDQGMQVQINMTVLTPDIGEVDQVVTLGKELGCKDFQLFIPVPTGRSQKENYERYGSYEELLKQVLRSYSGGSISLRPTCIPQFRRVAHEMGIVQQSWGRGCIAGISYCRIYANGDVTPCPYLPAIAGNLRQQRLAELWKTSEIFVALRDYERLKGKCGICEYKEICGGCRARAFSRYGSVTHSCGSLVRPVDIEGELCAQDPLCPYVPGGA
jgi:radical SAM protein with 4Fe4S-binding SPASM domain